VTLKFHLASSSSCVRVPGPAPNQGVSLASRTAGRPNTDASGGMTKLVIAAIAVFVDRQQLDGVKSPFMDFATGCRKQTPLAVRRGRPRAGTARVHRACP